MERLPEGFKRIGYDSDTAKFTFRDGNGQLYQGEAGADYGILTPMSAALSSRPNAFSSESGTFSVLYTNQPNDCARHQIHHQHHHHRRIVNKSRHSKISYTLTPSLLPLRLPKRVRPPSVLSKRLQPLSKIS